MILTNKVIATNDGKPLPLYQKALCGLTAGAIGVSVRSPADLALIWMQADATLPLTQRKNYKNAFHYLARISADEGVTDLWKGARPTVVRAMALNMGMLASYDQSVELFKDQLGFGEASTVVGASAVSGFFAAVFSLPFDYVKTQIQKMQPDATGKYPDSGKYHNYRDSRHNCRYSCSFIFASSLAFLAVLIISLVMGIVLNYTMFLCTSISYVLITTIVGVLKGVGSTILGFVLLGGVQVHALNLTGLVVYGTHMLSFSKEEASNGRHYLTLKLIINRTK
ncbi:hypothetical protein GIB67_012572 [Kingdonia uniflora]|uniref:Uncharacterized protein n=1 Tax=Kingdonia uniflora TaxID=39325 RepID=A0A7J7NER5_9MAGN|nr:hypothetical protein GIB67_012572 [Kingdonia uniflora]